MHGYDKSKLVSPRFNPDGSITCQCPACALNKVDLNGKNHLRIFPDGAFNCAVGSANDKEHNRIIRKLLKDPDAEVVQFIEPPEPTRGSRVEKVYPEDVLQKLLPDYSYWVKRGISADVLKKLENGIAPYEEKSKLSGRSIFPIRDIDSGQIVGFSGRILIPNSFAPKYKHVFKAGRAVYPWLINGEAIKRKRRVVLTEGVSDLITLMTHGIDETLCIFGLNLNGRIISTLIANDIKNVVISLNRDENPIKGQAASEKICNKLLNFYSPNRIIERFPPEGFKDWGEVAEAKRFDEIEKFKEELNNL